MEIEHKIKIYSKEAYLVVSKITVGKSKRTLFSSAIRKISILLKLAKEEQVYPLCKLLDIKQQVDDALTKVEEAIEVIMSQLKEKKIIIENYNFTAKDEINIKFGNPLIYQLAKLLKKFDNLICLLALTKNTGIQLSKRYYFTEKDKYQQMLFKLLSSIVQIDIREFLKVSIEDFINKTDVYNIASKKMDRISPKTVHTALQLSFSANLDENKITVYNQLLKNMSDT